MSEPDYKRLYEDEKKKTSLLEQKLASFEKRGNASLFYALNRNMNDLAGMLNKVNLTDINLDDPKDKTLERMKLIWASVTPIVDTLKALGQSSGITGNEDDDLSKRPFTDTIADKRN